MTDNSQIRRSPRDRAVKVLVACYDGRQFCRDLLGELQEADQLSPTDAALAAELVMGVSRHRITAEHLAARFYRGRWAGLRLHTRVILALAVYQLCWLDRIPDYAAIDQAVRQAKGHGRGTAAMTNAILRKLAACRGDVIDRPNDPAPRRYLAIDADRGRLFAENVFPDPAKRPLDHLIAVTSHPPWLVERWHRRFKPKLCREICIAGQRRPPLVLRPNPIRTTPDELFDSLTAGDHDPARLDDSDVILLRGAPPVAQVFEIGEGLCQPQDSTAQIPLRFSPPSPGELVLDLCAGVGTKSTQAAELMKNDGLVLATDVDTVKLAGIPETAERLGLTIIQTTPLDQLDDTLARVDRAPDLILVDVPCTNTGVLARRPEARYRATHKELLSLVEIQRNLLRRAEALAGPAARIVYATCSIEREENEDQLIQFCEEYPNWHVVKQVFTTPDQDHDGGFAAVLARE